MCDYTEIFKTTESQNWFRCWLAMRFTREGIIDFVRDRVTQLKFDIVQHILTTNNLPAETTCAACSIPSLGIFPCPTRNVCRKQRGKCLFHKTPVKPCPKRFCDAFRERIKKEHRFKVPSWRNTDATRWSVDPWELAKCFLPPDGYSHIQSANYTDFNGIMNILINCKFFDSSFQDDLGKESNVCTKARDVGRELRHNANFEVNDDTAAETFDILLNLLEDPKYLQGDKKAFESRNKINQLKNGSWIVTTKDIADAQEETRKIQADMKKYNCLKNDFRQDLKLLYEERHQAMPLSPLMPQIDDTLANFYVSPKLIGIPPNSDPTCERDDGKQLKTFSEIFFDENIRKKDIYIQGGPGTGKSTFCVHLVSIWCGNHEKKSDGASEDDSPTPDKDKCDHFTDYSVVQDIDFVFLIVLRRARGRDCDIENMINSQIVSELTRDGNYDQEFIGRILNEENCLILIDGLDEWTHPDNQCMINLKSIPHRKLWRNCHYVTTSRPWKMKVIQLNDDELNQIVLVGIETPASIIDKVIKSLNEMFHASRKSSDFEQQVEAKHLQRFLEIPIVLMQLICLWYEHHALGESKCDIHSNMIDMMFERACITFQIEACDGEDDSSLKLPGCFKEAERCTERRQFLLSLSELAFNTLLSHDRESTLVFSESVLTQYVSPLDQQLAFKTGILSQITYFMTQSKDSSTYHFLHKTFQEFLAALYLSTTQEADIVSKVFAVYGCQVDVLDISEIFEFVCGMNPQLAIEMSETITEKVNDGLRKFENMVSYANPCRPYQKMIVDGHLEIINNGHTDSSLVFQHAFIDCEQLSTAIQENIKRKLNYNPMLSSSDQINLKQLLDMNAGKLLTYIAWKNVPLDEILAEISRNKRLTTLVLYDILASGPETLDLACHNDLERLQLYFMESSNIAFNADLVQCTLFAVSNALETNVLTKLSHGAPRLQSLEVFECKNVALLLKIVALSPNLQNVDIVGTDLGDHDLTITNSVTYLALSQLDWSARAFQRFLDILTQIPHTVKCELRGCSISPEDEYDALKTHITASDLFDVTENLRHTFSFNTK